MITLSRITVDFFLDSETMICVEKAVAHALTVLDCWDFFTQQLQQVGNPVHVAEVVEKTRQRAKQYYKEQMTRVHPDKLTGDEAQAKRLNAAWDAVKDLRVQAPPPAPPPPTVIFTVFYGDGATHTDATSTTFSWNATGTGGFF